MSTSVSISDLQEALAAARQRLEWWNERRAVAEWDERRAAREALLAAERALAAAQNEPHAVPIEFPVQWDFGAPLPHLLTNDCRTFLVFFLRDIDPEWDGTYINVRHADSESPSNLAVVEFNRCICTKMGTPNDEVLLGHPLAGKGLDWYSPFRVENSPWIKELEAINSIHHNYNPEHWRSFNHYIFGFHDSTFECVAKSFTVDMRVATLPNLLAEICGKLVGRGRRRET
jgi:hypothetical protein